MKVSFVVATSNRRGLLEKAIDSILLQDYSNIEVIIVSNGSNDGTKDLFSEEGKFSADNIKFYHYESALGVSKARNIGYREATGQVVITLDDDARLADDQATSKIVQEFQSSESLGILSFRIENHYTGEVDPQKIPTTDKSKSPYDSFECAYFLGGGNAIHSDVFDSIGYYPPNFEYSFEELDFSYRAIDAGFRIRYLPSVCVIHEAQPKSGGVDKAVLEQYLTNRVRVAIRNLPLRYVIISSILWCGHILLRSNLDPRPLTRAITSIWSDSNELMSARDVVDESTVNTVQINNGRLFK